MNIQQQLFALRDPVYQAFARKLMPTVPAEQVLGVRSPDLKQLAKKLSEEERQAFLQALPHTYYEENQLHAYLIMKIRDYESCMTAVEAFLPYVDNWSTCDCLGPKGLIKEPEKLLLQVECWLKSDHAYTVRYAIGTLQRFFLDERFEPRYLHMAASVQWEEYYVKMMVAWYFATALAKQYEAAIPFLEQKILEKWTHNKTIQKATESYRISPNQKAYLRSLKRK